MAATRGQAVEDENKEVRGEPPVALQTADWLPQMGEPYTAVWAPPFHLKPSYFHMNITGGNTHNGHPVPSFFFYSF